MNMEIQDLSSLNTYLQGRLRRSPNARLSALFRNCRKHSRISYIGDYPLICHLIQSIYSATKRNASRWEVLRAFNTSQELSAFSKKDKTILLNQLLTISLSQDTQNDYKMPF